AGGTGSGRGVRGLRECGEVRLEAVGADEEGARGRGGEAVEGLHAAPGDVADRCARERGQPVDGLRGPGEGTRGVRVVPQRGDDRGGVEGDEQDLRGREEGEAQIGGGAAGRTG